MKKISLPPLALLGCAAWLSAALLLSLRNHFVYGYVVYQDLPRGDETPWNWFAIILFGLLLGFGAVVADRRAVIGKSRNPYPCLWLLSCAVIPVLQQLQTVGQPVSATFFEPLYFSFATGMAVWTMQSERPQEKMGLRWIWDVCVCAAIVLAMAWWYHQGQTEYNDYQLGYPDFADYARRVVNTYEGRSFLAKSPLWPTFYDHFQPGLALLTPLWGIWPDARLFLFLQAFCLAVPAAFVYGMAKRFGAEPAGAAAWATAYLTLPAVGQLNLSYSYGFHPVSLALVLVMGSLWAAFCRRPILALGLAVVACTIEECVFVALAGTALAIAVVEFRARRRCLGDLATENGTSVASPTGLTPRTWVLAAIGFAAGFAWVIRLANLTEGTLLWRFQNLGGSLTEVALSPLLRPAVFWTQVFRAESFYFVLSLFAPAGLMFVIRGWPALIGLAAPLVVLMTWSVDGSTCIAFQYITLFIPCIVLAALLGSQTFFKGEASRCATMTWAGITVLASSVVASFFLGGLPLSCATMPYTSTSEERASTAPRREALDRAVKLVDRPDAVVLASSRLAAHLLGVRRLEDVNFALRKRKALAKEAGQGQRWIEVFDEIAVDLTDRQWNHSLDDLRTVVMEAEAAGYRAVFANHGVLVYRRSKAASDSGDALDAWRMPPAEAEALARGTSWPTAVPGLRVLRIATTHASDQAVENRSVNVEIVFRAMNDAPPDCCYRFLMVDAQGAVAAETNIRLPADGNRPTHWWKSGETWRDLFTIELPPGVLPDRLNGKIDVIPLEAIQKPCSAEAKQATDGTP